MQKPNILFLLIDGLRADKFYGDIKTSKTPNLDSLIKKGTYFEQTISTADGTFLSLNSIFNAVFPFVTNIRTRKLVFTDDNYLTNLINFDYHIYGLVPRLTSLKPLTGLFENENNTYSAEPPNVLHLQDGLGNQILNMLNSSKMNEPWFYYIHLNDLHWPLQVPTDFDKKVFGTSPYEKLISLIDYWIGKLVEHIEFDKTLVIITSDHGTLIPVDNKGITDFEPDQSLIIKIGKHFVPKSLYSSATKLLSLSNRIITKIKLAKVNQNLTSYQKRSRLPYFTLSLFDESVHIPLLFVGNHIPPKLIKQQVCSVDIFPTIAELINMHTTSKKHGRSLTPYFENGNLEEVPIYLHTIPYEKISSNDKVGIRTSRYKYFRASLDPTKNVHLYDLENDPQENNNIAKKEPLLVTKMETTLQDIIKSSLPSDTRDEKSSEEETKKIQEELKKLGYI